MRCSSISTDYDLIFYNDLYDGVLGVLNCEGKLDFIRENSFSILSSQVRRTLLYSLLISFAIKITPFSRYLRKIGKNRTYLK